jgi:hypothetical protein
LEVAMKSRYAVSWRRSNGAAVTIEQMSDSELIGAWQMLQREDASDPTASTLYDAISEEMDQRHSTRVSTVTRRAA